MVSSQKVKKNQYLRRKAKVRGKIGHKPSVISTATTRLFAATYAIFNQSAAAAATHR